MEHTGNLHLAHRGSRKGGEHDTAQGISERQTIASLKRFADETAKRFVFGDLSNLDIWFLKFEQE